MHRKWLLIFFFLIELISLIILKKKKLKLNNECDYRDVKD